MSQHTHKVSYAPQIIGNTTKPNKFIKNSSVVSQMSGVEKIQSTNNDVVNFDFKMSNNNPLGKLPDQFDAIKDQVMQGIASRENSEEVKQSKSKVQ
jgi:hypothetical protein